MSEKENAFHPEKPQSLYYEDVYKDLVAAAKNLWEKERGEPFTGIDDELLTLFPKDVLPHTVILINQKIDKLRQNPDHDSQAVHYLQREADFLITMDYFNRCRDHPYAAVCRLIPAIHNFLEQANKNGNFH